LGPPDMKLPIQYALTYPQRWEGPAERLDLTSALRLDFEPPDVERFPALRLGHEVAAAGGTAGAVLNAANEIAVEAFLGGLIPFGAIADTNRGVLERHLEDRAGAVVRELPDVRAADAWARGEARTRLGLEADPARSVRQEAV